MTEAEKIEKIKEIYQHFLLELSTLKKQASDRMQKKISFIEQQKIDELLNKIHKEF